MNTHEVVPGSVVICRRARMSVGLGLITKLIHLHVRVFDLIDSTASRRPAPQLSTLAGFTRSAQLSRGGDPLEKPNPRDLASHDGRELRAFLPGDDPGAAPRLPLPVVTGLRRGGCPMWEPSLGSAGGNVESRFSAASAGPAPRVRGAG